MVRTSPNIFIHSGGQKLSNEYIFITSGEGGNFHLILTFLFTAKNSDTKSYQSPKLGVSYLPENKGFWAPNVKTKI